jgi:hypothetical protein
VLAEMSDLPGGVHGLNAQGTVTADDYARAFAPLVDRVQWAGGTAYLGGTGGAAFKTAKLLISRGFRR